MAPCEACDIVQGVSHRTAKYSYYTAITVPHRTVFAVPYGAHRTLSPYVVYRTIRVLCCTHHEKKEMEASDRTTGAKMDDMRSANA